jgi:formylglycine-generating enzyme required for sulfatase activity
MGPAMADSTLLQQTRDSLAALRDFAQANHNALMLDVLTQLEANLAAFAAASSAVASGDISVGNIRSEGAVRIGHDIQIIVNQVLPPPLKESWQAVQQGWGRAHLEIRKLSERGRHLFLSYSRADAETAFAIRRALEAAGHTVWQDLTAIKGGDEWIKSIEAGVERCYALVMVVSAAFEHSEWMQIEYLHAKRRGKPIIPLLVDKSEIPTLLLATQVIHAHPELEPGIQQLLAAAPRPPTIPPPAEDWRALELRYLDGLLLEHSVWQQVYTPMAGVGQLRAPEPAAAPGRVRMRTAPTTIDVGYLGQKFAPHPRAEQPEPAEPKRYEADLIPAVEEMRQLVILGEPGAGKTTTLWKILSDRALKAKDEPHAPLPVLVRLGAWDEKDWAATVAGALGPLGAHYAALLNERRLIFLLDGLNELPAAGRDAHLAELRALLQHCQRHDLVVAVTCRELDYTGALDLNLPGRVTIMPLDPIRVHAFVNAYLEEPGKGDELFWQLAGPDAQKRWEQFSREVGEPLEVFWLADVLPGDRKWGWWSDDNRTWDSWLRERKHPRSMLGLAANPYMLYMMTRVFTETGELPRNRGLLFQTFIDYLLEKRERLSTEAADALKQCLADLAYALQQAGAGTTFSTVQALGYLGADGERLLYHARSASLLAGGHEARFTHQLLQEYFAAHHLQTLMAHTSAAALFSRKNWWEPQGWEETLILLAGLYNDDCTPVVDWLKDAQPEVAARCIAESGAYCPDAALEDLRARWTPRLADLKNDLEPKARVAVGRALGRLRLSGRPLDNRKGVSISPLPLGEGPGVRALPDIDWVEIPRGEFIYQNGEARSEPTFYLARYPITYAQFQTFIDDPQGFANPRWWEGLAADDEHKRAPDEQGFKFDNHPRESVSWYDAVAFCRWLTAQARTYPQLLPEAWRTRPERARCEISLPTEWRWEKAARGAKGLEYSYGRGFDAARANTDETGIRQTSAVGIFPNGASPYGVEEMSGNVWEWCLNEYGEPNNLKLSGSATRVVRGGSWVNHRNYARAVSRFRYGPVDRYFFIGFRVGVRPPSL